MNGQDSPFFAIDKALVTPQPKRPRQDEEASQNARTMSEPSMKTHSDDGKSSGEDNHDAAPPRHHDTVIPRYPDDMLDQVRKAVKQLGKEAATYRFTRAEKQALDEIVFTKKQQGIRTSGNEITRIAINFILWEYREYQEDSVLAQILDRLNA